MSSETSITELLARWNDGDASALDALMPLVVEDLRRIARRIADDATGTLQPTVLVNELYLRLIESRKLSVGDRSHFFSLSAHIMRHVLVDHARRRMAKKRGGDTPKVPLDDVMEHVGVRSVHDDPTLLALHDAMSVLEARNPVAHRIVELTIFGGFAQHEISDLLDIPQRTVRRRWDTAKVMLYDLMLNPSD